MNLFSYFRPEADDLQERLVSPRHLFAGDSNNLAVSTLIGRPFASDSNHWAVSTLIGR